MARYSPEELGFIDEVSKDERTVGRRYGRLKRGRRVRRSQSFVRRRRTSMVGCLTLDGFVSGTTVEGSLTKDRFLHWLEFSLVCYLLLYVSIVLTCAVSQMQPISRSPERSGPRQCQNTPWRRDPHPCRPVRHSDRVPTALFPRLEPNRGSLLKNQAFHSTQSRLLWGINR
jgi:hypothetical protein